VFPHDSWTVNSKSKATKLNHRPWPNDPTTHRCFEVERSKLRLHSQMKKSAQRDAHATRWAKTFRPAADPLPGGAGRPKFNQLEMVTTFTDKPSLVRIDACNFELTYRGNRPTNTPRPPVANTQTGPITIHCAAKLWAQCKYVNIDGSWAKSGSDLPGVGGVQPSQWFLTPPPSLRRFELLGGRF